MKRIIPYAVAFAAGLMIWALLTPSLFVRRGTQYIGGECLMPVYCVCGTALVRNRKRLKAEWDYMKEVSKDE